MSPHLSFGNSVFKYSTWDTYVLSPVCLILPVQYTLSPGWCPLSKNAAMSGT